MMRTAIGAPNAALSGRAHQNFHKTVLRRNLFLYAMTTTKNEPVKNVTMYTDGACLGNPGPGGYGVILKYNHQEKELSAGYRLTTNNRMELMAAIQGLAALKTKCTVTLYSDSQYIVDAVNKGWARSWKAKGWMRNKKDAASNPDLWDALLTLVDKHSVTFVWVRGHAGHPGNERCDVLAVNAAKYSKLLVDEKYEKKDTGY